MLSLIQNFDTAILDFVQIHLRNNVLDIIMPIITLLGDSGLLWVSISIILVLNKKYRHVGLLVCTALLLNMLLGDCILKNLIQRPRPFSSGLHINLLIPEPTSYSFPSGHTSSSFAAAGILSKEFRKYRIFIIIAASLIAFSRIYLYVHYLTDIIGGVCLGLFCSKTVLFIYDYKVKKPAL